MVLKLKWKNYVLADDVKAIEQEIDAAGDGLAQAMLHILNALQHHGTGNFNESRKLVNMAVDRLEDWERSDKEMLAAFVRHLEDVRKNRWLESIKELNSRGIEAEIITFERREA